ncbi:acyltransferase [Sediminibacterium ginsengisoli]|uniref:Maltose O-acetyltransferase n=1 Tax=Sediminibacterium ginsengisoli TaxID=413434 RepID=A0A1T4Q5B1_9BACT|nr:acyltransferase [Sediminibacterium ginsengisoli]SJZ98963.1 maltose O-acetyltransferase [Sediminibacterium ginsengisoli]
MLSRLEPLLLRMPYGLMSRIRILIFRLLGLTIGRKNRMEGGRCRRLTQIEIGDNNAFTKGFMLWPEDADHKGIRIRIGNYNYFNRNCMLDACGEIQIGNHNMIGPDVYITDSDHAHGVGISPAAEPMKKGSVKIGDHCWIGAKAVLLKNVALGDYCVVAAGAVVTKSFPAGSVIGGVPAKLLKHNGEKHS